jgi:hypothetical protein
MATDKKTDKKTDIPVNSKGFRKSYSDGVVGWQVYLANMRFFVNVNQYASAVSADKKLIDYTQKGIVEQTKYLAENKVKVPARLASRLDLAKKAKHPSFKGNTADFAKGLRKLVDLYETADKTGQALIKSACLKALKTPNVKATNRLRKRIADMS